MSKTSDDEMRDDFHWVYTDEPHATRRKEILKKYPQIRELFGHEPRTKYTVVAIVAAQFIIAYLLRNSPIWWLLFVAYVVGGTLNHSLNLAVHEISHNLLFPKVWQNRLFGYVAELPIPVHTSVTFLRYHMEHHKFQGIDGIDSDIPSKLEAALVTNTFTKFIWVCLMPFFYALRPLIEFPKTPSKWEILGWVIQIIVDGLVVYYGNLQMLFYMLCSTFMGTSFHAAAGHFIAEHYVFIDDQETYSYYGPLNWVCFNVGYHNEHHDFPRIPGSRLPEVTKIAPEFYEHLAVHDTWSGVIWKYITDPKIGPYSRVKREATEKQKKAKRT